MQLEQAKAAFEAELEARQTEQGVWENIITWYVISRKPKNGVITANG